MKKIFCFILLYFIAGYSFAQFPPQAPEPGNDAIPQDDNRIVGWATGCTVQRGWENISDTSLGKTTSGNVNSVFGPPDLNVLSLGDGGSAIVTFNAPIKDGPGPDFAVFENGFVNPVNGYEAYLEFAFVSVSSDGVHYVTFPATSLTQDTVQVDNATYMDARLINNLAGKYANGYGTPFDLSELVDSPNLDIQHIRFVKITDVVGSINPKYARYDHEGHIINDPFPTPFPTGGFDLNAIAVLNQQPTGIYSFPEKSSFQFWPIPARDFIFIQPKENEPFNYLLYTLDSREIRSGKGDGKTRISLAGMPSGTYFVKCVYRNGESQTAIFNKW